MLNTLKQGINSKAKLIRERIKALHTDYLAECPWNDL